MLEVEIVNLDDFSTQPLDLKNYFTLDSEGTPSSKELQNFERDPRPSIALLALATNSSQNRFLTTNLLHPHTSAEIKNSLSINFRQHLTKIVCF